MALAALHLVGLSVAAGLVAGTGAVATRMIPSGQDVAAASAMTAPAGRPCAAQTWPYLTRNCLAASEQTRRIRLVAAPSGVEPVLDSGAGTEADAVAGAPSDPALVTGDTVLHQPQRLATLTPEAPAKPRVKHVSARHERRFVAQSYQVPSEARGDQAKPVIVVRPLTVEFVKPCDDRRC